MLERALCKQKRQSRRITKDSSHSMPYLSDVGACYNRSIYRCGFEAIKANATSKADNVSERVRKTRNCS
jgi:hypothetical protein